MGKTLKLILGDQLNEQHTWFEKPDEDTVFVMMEVLQETNYVRHHIQKVLGFFAAMRQFRQRMEARGHRFNYFTLDDPKNQQSIPENLMWLIENQGFTHFAYQLPDEFRLDEQLREFCSALAISSEAADTEHFLTDRDFLPHFFKGKKTYLLETFYRHLRKEFGLLMDEKGQPIGEKWNLDAENRKPYDQRVPVPKPEVFSHDLSELYQMLEKTGVATIGRVDPKKFMWPTNRDECLQWLNFFLEHQLEHFGTYEDAMEKDHPVLFHSRLSFAMNTKMLSPLEVVQAAVAYWESRQESISLSQIEGFVRQIIGWREYMRGVYWAKMPDYAQLNFFEHERSLPEFYWTGNTKMACLGDAINRSLDNAYAHHIQRLMITGNFALLAGIHPDAVDAWYLGIYIDAIEWVEITNTRGMSQFADGGIVGTKPYVSSANYIDKMSSYCKSCHYQKNKKTGDKACPFNSFYWHFYERNRDKLAKNPRIGMAYRTLDKMNPKQRAALMEQAESYLAKLDKL